MRALNRMLLADVRRMWRQGLAISTLLACGLAVFVMSGNSMKSLRVSLEDYYLKGNFADLFVGLVRAPNQLADRIEGIQGVARVQTRVSRDVLLDVPEMIEPASCKLVSIEGDQKHSLNRVYVRRGRYPNEVGRVEVIVSELFAEAHSLAPGDRLTAIMGGRKQTLHIVGVGLSAEYVYVVQPGLLVTDDKRYGVLWMPRRQMESAFNMEGAFNDLTIQLRPQAVKANVIQQVDRLTRPFGGTGAFDRDDLPSHRRVSDEIEQMGTMAYVTPTIFLAVSAFLFNIVFSRLVQQQKEQIATLRAFGYLSREIGMHYVKMVGIFVGFGAIIGLAGGMWLSDWMLTQYARFFRFPNMHYEFAYGSASSAIAIGLIVALLGTFSSIRQAMKLVPAEAMRPEAPKEYRDLWAERIGLSKALGQMGRMVVRRLETNLRATTLSVLGMSLALAVLVLGSFFEDTIDYLIDHQFQRSQRQDIMLTFNEKLSASSIHDAMHLPGVTRVEPFRSVAVRMRAGRNSYRVGIMGLDSEPDLYRILDDRGKPIPLPPLGGLTISQKLAEILNVHVGDEITLEILEGDRVSRKATVARTYQNFTEPTAYLNRRELHKLLREAEQYSGVFLAVSPSMIDDVYREIKETPSVAGVMDKNAAMTNFREMVSESTAVMRTVNAIFAMTIAFGVIYNCAMIIMAERARDLATLRVMGFTRQETSRVLVGEIAMITLMAIPIGLPIGYAFSYFVTVAMDTETNRFPLIVERYTFAYSTTVILLATTISAVYLRRMVNGLDLISVLKVKD